MGAPAKVALALWALMVGLILFMALNAPHSTPSLEILIPRSDPLTWIVPALVAAPPLLLAIARHAPPRLASSLDWSLVAVLAGLFAAFHLSTLQ
jgi:hypothetical protein